MIQSVELFRRDTLFLIGELWEFKSSIVPVFISSPLDQLSYTKFSRLMLNEHFWIRKWELRTAFVCISCIAYAFCYFYTNNRKMFKPKVKDRSALRRAFSFKKRSKVSRKWTLGSLEISGTSHLRICPRKCLKTVFLIPNSRVDRLYWYHFSSFLILYRFSQSVSENFHPCGISKKSRH